MSPFPIADLKQLVTGPIQHMAPETLQAVLGRALPTGQRALSSAADIFSLGVLLKRLLVGKWPFTSAAADVKKQARKIAAQHTKWQVGSCF